MKSLREIKAELRALRRLAARHRDDAAAQASIAGQIQALSWAAGFPND